jgi:hypothetical protein
MSQGQVAKALGCKVPKISLTESAQRNVQDNDLQKMLELFEVPETRRTQYFDAARNARKKGWWERYDEHTMPDWLEVFVGLEQGASRLRAYQTAVFHGLLHTPEYAAAILRSSTTELASEEKVERIVELRTRRQQILWRDSDPLEVSAVADEAVLRHVVGNREVMRAQFEHVTDVVDKHDNVTFQIIPFDRGTAKEAFYGPFTILSFLPTDPGVVYMEHRSGAVFLEDLDEIDTHSLIFEELQSLALPVDESVELLRRTAAEYASG